MDSNANAPSNAKDDEDDPIVREIDVYWSNPADKNLAVIQYPLRPANRPIDSSQVLAVRMKPKQEKLQLELAIDTESKHYDQAKGRRVAAAAATARGDESDDFYQSPLMDRQILESDSSSPPSGRYAIGVMRNGALHLTPVQHIFRMKPSFSYVDKADKGKTTATSTTREVANDGHESEDEARPVTVRLVRQGDNKGRASREMAARQKQMEWEDEKWVDLRYSGPDSERADQKWESLKCPTPDVRIEFNSTPEQYLRRLCPAPEKDQSSDPTAPSHVVSLAHLKNLDLIDQVKTLLTSAKVMRFNQLCLLLEASSKQATVLKILPSIAWLVQGCWVVKSELIYPEGKASPLTGISAEALRKGRDYVLWKFSQTRFIIRKEVSSIVKLPFDDLKDILEQIAKLRVTQGWEFVGEYDEEFVKRHGDVVARQQQLWEARYRQLCQELGIAKTDKIEPQKTAATLDSRKSSKDAGAGAGTKPSAKTKTQPTKAKEKSKSLKTSPPKLPKTSEAPSEMEWELEPPQPIVIDMSGGGDSTTQPMEVEVNASTPHHQSHGLTALVKAAAGSQESLPLASSSIGVAAPARIPATLSQVSDTVVQSVRSSLGRTVKSLKDLRDVVTGVHTGPEISDAVLERVIRSVGGVEIEYKRRKDSAVRLFALRSTKDPADKYRHFLLDLFKESVVWQKKDFIKRIKDALDVEPTQRDVTKVLKDLCKCKSNKYWQLIGSE